jgi:hypothetical protein
VNVAAVYGTYGMLKEGIQLRVSINFRRTWVFDGGKLDIGSVKWRGREEFEEAPKVAVG